jgi:hypothetical protein
VTRPPLRLIGRNESIRPVLRYEREPGLLPFSVSLCCLVVTVTAAVNGWRVLAWIGVVGLVLCVVAASEGER